MVAFFRENLYSMVKLLINQFGMTVFGTMLALACASNPTLLLLSSVFSILFYLFLIYSSLWEIGAKDKIRIDGGRMKPFAQKGLLIALGANLPNLLLALGMGVGAIINQATSAKWAGSMSVICNAIARLAEGMYLGVIKMLEDVVFENPTIFDVWWWFLIIILPSLFVGGLAYFFGSREIRILPQIKSTPHSSGKNSMH